MTRKYLSILSISLLCALTMLGYLAPARAYGPLLRQMWWQYAYEHSRRRHSGNP